MSHRTDADLQAYLDAELQGAAAGEVAAHLLTCTECRARLGELRLAGDRFRAALGELDTAPAADRFASRSRLRSAGWRTGGARSALRAAVLLLVVAGAAMAVVPGSPLRLLIDRLVSDDVVSVPAETIAPRPEPEAATPGIASVTVSPEEGRVDVIVRRFPSATILRVRFGPGSDVRARLLSGHEGVRFSVGAGRLFLIGTDSSEPSEILIELPRGLDSATLEVDGERKLVASGGEFHRPGDSGELAQEEVILRVGG